MRLNRAAGPDRVARWLLSVLLASVLGVAALFAAIFTIFVGVPWAAVELLARRRRHAFRPSGRVFEASYKVLDDEPAAAKD